MSSEKTSTGVGHSPAYPKRVSLYETEEGVALLKDLARRRGVSSTDVLRMLIREEAIRLGISPAAAHPLDNGLRTESAPPSPRPIWEELVEIGNKAKEEDPTPLPNDLAEQHDRYIYGTPKR